jgi:choline transport protein
MVWSMIFCSVTSWLGAILMMWCAGDWETYMEGLLQPFLLIRVLLLTGTQLVSLT